MASPCPKCGFPMEINAWFEEYCGRCAYVNRLDMYEEAPATEERRPALADDGYAESVPTYIRQWEEERMTRPGE